MVAVGVTYIVVMQELSANLATGIVPFITALAQGMVIVSGIVVVPDALSAVLTDHGFLVQTIGAQRLAVEIRQFRQRKISPALTTYASSFVHIAYLQTEIAAPGNYPEAFIVIVYTWRIDAFQRIAHETVKLFEQVKNAGNDVFGAFRFALVANGIERQFHRIGRHDNAAHGFTEGLSAFFADKSLDFQRHITLLHLCKQDKRNIGQMKQD